MAPDLAAALQTVLRASHLVTPDDIPALTADAARRIGADNALIYVIDYDQTTLVPLEDPRQPPVYKPVGVDGTLAGRAYTDIAQFATEADSVETLWTPLLDGTERLGVLQLLFPTGTKLDDGLLAMCRDFAALLAELVMTRTFYGDVIERARRQTGLTVPAEMQWRLLPPLTFVSPKVGIAGVLLPAESVAGDTFDYSLNADIAHVAIFDAMGHGLEATLLAGVAISTLRNARRNGADLGATVRAIDAVIAAQFGPDRFVTGIVGELDTTTGVWRWITCGHPPTLLVRSGRVVKQLDQVIDAPLGLGLLADQPEIGHERLERGDRLLLYTDGVVEARDGDGDFFGTERLVGFVTRESAAGRPIAETLRRLTQALLSYQAGTLQDDATTVVVEWLSDQPERSTPS
jgi:hypothetical protein